MAAAHQERPLILLHAHDWYNVPAALRCASELELPLVLTLHSTEHERAHGAVLSSASCTIREWEQQGIEAAELVIVPHSSTRQQLVEIYGASEHKVFVVADVLEQQQHQLPDAGAAKMQLGIPADAPLVLFAAEISHAAGADLLVDALINVCREHHQVHFAFAGEGPLRWELEGRVGFAGLAHRCRFVGDIPAERFESLLLACEFVVIPARTWQDEGLAQLATSYGKPVLITHQSQIRCINHGQNGLITYDNPGSIIWGVKELLANPLHGSMLRLATQQRAAHTQSLESIATELYVLYERALAQHAARRREVAARPAQPARSARTKTSKGRTS